MQKTFRFLGSGREGNRYVPNVGTYPLRSHGGKSAIHSGGPPDRAPSSPGAASHSDGSVFSDEGDQTIIAIEEQANNPPAVVNTVVPPNSPTGSVALRTVEQAAAAQNDGDPTYAPFRRAVECRKHISDVLFDPTTKVTNPQRAKILCLLRQIIEECSDLRAMAANQTGRVQESRHHIAQATTASFSNMPVGRVDGTSAHSYAAVAARGLARQVQESTVAPTVL